MRPFPLLITVAILGLNNCQPKPSTSGGLDSQRYTGPPPSDPGRRDALGYLLPLDVRRPQPPKPFQPPPARAEIERRRAARKAGLVPEFTLSADD